MLTPQEEANLLLSQWQREAEERSRAKAAALQLGECFDQPKETKDADGQR